MKKIRDYVSHGMCKHYAVVWSMFLSFIGGAFVRIFAPDTDWNNPIIFFIVWILFLQMIHNPTLDKPEDLYRYKFIKDKSFIDEQDMQEFLDSEGGNGWSLIAIKPSASIAETYSFLFKSKYYSKNHPAKFEICQ